MKNKYVFVLIMLAYIFVVSAGLTALYVKSTQQPQKQNDILIVTSFYPMYIAALNVVGSSENVTLENLSEPQTGCLHDFQLTPEDIKLLSEADAFIINGGGIEAFMEQVASTYPQLAVVDASAGIELLGDDGDDPNAHIWMSIADHRRQLGNIADALEELDPANADRYRANAKAYDDKLAGLAKQQEALAQQVAGENVILFHEAYAYVARDLGLRVSYVLDLDEERQVSAGEVSDLLGRIGKDQVSFILAEELYGRDMGDMVEAEVDAKVLYIDSLTRGEYSADSYLKGMQNNLDLLQAMAGT